MIMQLMAKTHKSNAHCWEPLNRAGSICIPKFIELLFYGKSDERDGSNVQHDFLTINAYRDPD